MRGMRQRIRHRAIASGSGHDAQIGWRLDVDDDRIGIGRLDDGGRGFARQQFRE